MSGTELANYDAARRLVRLTAVEIGVALPRLFARRAPRPRALDLGQRAQIAAPPSVVQEMTLSEWWPSRLVATAA
jgi:hypothetical protein